MNAAWKSRCVASVILDGFWIVSPMHQVPLLPLKWYARDGKCGEAHCQKPAQPNMLMSRGDAILGIASIQHWLVSAIPFCSLLPKFYIVRDPCNKQFSLLLSSIAPLFVFQWLFDEAQMRADSVGAPVTPQQWDYIHEMGGALRTSLDNVTAVFAPSCIGHSVLTKRDWLHIKIDDISLAQALRCWELSTRHGNKELSRRDSDGKKQRNKRRKDKNTESQMDENERCKERRRRNRERNRNKIDGQQHRERHQERRRNMTKEERQRRRKNLRCKNQTTKVPMATSIARSERSPLGNDHMRNNNDNSGRFTNAQRLSNKLPRNGTDFGNNHRRNNGHKRRRNRNQENQKAKKPIAEPQKCSLRLLERCSWPQCNHSCPTLTNPLTGEEMRFLELLSSFGLDIEAVATALGVDMQTLNNMEHAELVNLLTQQAS